jgi:hypothetical protein
VPQVRRGQIGTNQAVVERERRVELNLGGRKGKERKVLGLGLGARISRRGVRAHEVGRHLQEAEVVPACVDITLYAIEPTRSRGRRRSDIDVHPGPGAPGR